MLTTLEDKSSKEIGDLQGKKWYNKEQSDSFKQVEWVRMMDYSTWLSIVILQNKVEGDHERCIDFKDVNTITTKYCFLYQTMANW